MPDRPLAARLVDRIGVDGPLSLETVMALSNASYYASRDPLGVAGDFTTAPEISQLFGELIGGWVAELALRAGAGSAFALVELGPGRGTLMADALRVLARAGLSPPVHFVETSPVLRAAQAGRVPHACWHDDIATLPDARPLVVIANEFFDALPIRQYRRTPDGWRERLVTATGTGTLRWTPGAMDAAVEVPPALRDGAVGTVVEASPAAVALARTIGDRLAARGGALLAIDYGHAGPAAGDTLQALRAHRPVDPLSAPGEADWTAHVDFTALGDGLRAGGATVHPMTTQGAFLWSLGLGERAAALARANPARAEAIGGEVARLAGRDGMGDLFQVLTATGGGWPMPAGV